MVGLVCHEENKFVKASAGTVAKSSNLEVLCHCNGSIVVKCLGKALLDFTTIADLENANRWLAIVDESLMNMLKFENFFFIQSDSSAASANASFKSQPVPYIPLSRFNK
jgi:hypothetical protein